MLRAEPPDEAETAVDGALSRVGRFLTSLYEPELPGFRFSSSGATTLLSTAFAVQTLYLTDSLGQIHCAKLGLRIASTQSEDGTFIDPGFRVADTRGSHAEDYLRWQFSYFALCALDMLGGSPSYNLEFVAPLLDRRRLTAWFEQLNWRNFWYSSNQLMFLLYFLTYRAERQGDTAARDTAQRCLDLLDAAQDPKTGLWGCDRRIAVHNRLYGSAHVVMFHDYYGREIRYPERIVDAALALQAPTGLFGSRYGGACEDYDAIEVLLKVGAQTGYRRADIRASLRRAVEALLRGQDSTGGFAYRLAPKGSGPLATLRACLLRRRTYSYSGWRKMTTSEFEPDAWATYFRALSLCATQRYLGERHARFYELPAWGYGLRGWASSPPSLERRAAPCTQAPRHSVPSAGS